MKKLLFAAAAFAACMCASADAPRSFAATVEDYLATHPVAGMETYADFCRLVAQPAANGAVDATVQPCHKARKIRFWGALEHMSVFKSWGLDVAEFDPDAADRGDYPDVIFCHLAPGYCQGDVDQILDAVRHGTHFVTLQTTDRWSEVIAKRLGHTYGGVLTAPAMDRGGVFFKNCPKLFAGFPEGRLDAPLFSCVGKSRHGMFLTGETCLLGVADTHTGRIASSIAQYKYGKGAVTLVGPCVNQSSAKDMNAPAYKRLLLNLVDLLPPVAREKPYDVLLYTRWMWHRDPKTGAVAPKGSYHHFSTEIGAGEMARYFTAKGLTVKVTDDPEVFRTAAFRACPRMVFACANEEQFETESQRAAFYAWAKAGGGTLVLHSASNCEVGSKEWRDFLGGTFLFHYPRQMPVPFADADKSNPAIACMPAGYVWPREEIYVNDMVPGAVKPVLKFDARAIAGDMQKWIKDRGRAPADGTHILEWMKTYGKGRVYYSALGHNADSFSRPEFLEHLYQACLWTAPISAAR